MGYGDGYGSRQLKKGIRGEALLQPPGSEMVLRLWIPVDRGKLHGRLAGFPVGASNCLLL